MSTPPKPLIQQSGVVLLESLIAILLFSMGILGIVGLQATAVKQVTDARYRSEASLLVDQLLGTMWVSDRSTAALQASFSDGGAGYQGWLGSVSAALPGVDTYPPSVAVDANGIVTITIRWRAPSEEAAAGAHQYIAVAQIR
ncbi:MAG: pilus assembly protein PilV [Noviherbaspirillum sp.]